MKRNLLALIIPALIFSAGALTTYAQVDYQMLAPLPVVANSEGVANVQTYLPGIIKLIIGLAGVLAVAQIVIGGFQYMTTDAFQGKSGAKETIKNAVFGFLLVISSYVILNTLNPNLVKVNLKIDKVGSSGGLESTVGKIPDKTDVDAERSIIGCVGCAAVAPGYVDPGSIGTTPPKPPSSTGADGSGCKSTTACYVNHELGQKLLDLTKVTKEFNQNMSISDKRVYWQVTELYPPTRTHLHPCQKPNTSVSGMCVDAALRELSCANQTTCQYPAKDAYRIKFFVDEANKLGLVPVYEVTSDARAQMLIKSLASIGASNIRVVVPKKADGTSWISREHFSIYLNESVRSAKN